MVESGALLRRSGLGIPRQIGRFRIDRLLGKGGYATVWLAYDQDLDSAVAIKVLADNWSTDADVSRRFLEEARILRRLDDDRTVRVHAIDRLEDGRPYFVMEYADRGSLLDRIDAHRRDQRAFSIEEGLGISREIAESLIVVHGLGVIHRDLKPSNVLFRTRTVVARESVTQPGIDPAERLLLADFGIARRLDQATGHTITAGTPWYAAPEQTDPRTATKADARSDVYAAGVILKEMITEIGRAHV